MSAVCPQCDGGGEVAWNPSLDDDPQCVETGTCPRCEGAGREPSAEAGQVWAIRGHLRR